MVEITQEVRHACGGLKVLKKSPLALLANHSSVSFRCTLIGLSTVLFFTLPAHALSVTSAETIVGTEPYLLLSDGVTKLTSLDDLLGFSMPNQDGSGGIEQIDTSMQGILLAIPSGMKYQDVITLVTADGSPHSVPGLTVGDDDGDASLAANASVGGAMKATWYYAGTKITDLSQPLSACGGPYTLTIELPTAFSANTVYGVPNTKLYGSATATYTFLSPKMCNIQPASMTVNTGTAGVSIKYAAGYNPLVWEYDSSFPTALRHRGFKVGSGFPTTGFNKAVFNVIGSGIDQSKYRCSSSDDGEKIILSGAASASVGEKCQVTYNSATRTEFTSGGTTPTIKMEYNRSDSTWIQIGSYTIPTPTSWALPQATVYNYGNTVSLATSTSFPALDRCRVVIDGSAVPATTRQQAAGLFPADLIFRQTYMYRRDELSNSPYVDRTLYPEGSSPTRVASFSSRDVDGTFMGEWGSGGVLAHTQALDGRLALGSGRVRRGLQ